MASAYNHDLTEPYVYSINAYLALNQKNEAKNEFQNLQNHPTVNIESEKWKEFLTELKNSIDNS